MITTPVNHTGHMLLLHLARHHQVHGQSKTRGNKQEENENIIRLFEIIEDQVC